jgi:integrase
MPRKPSGEVRHTSDGYSTRVRVGKARETFQLPTVRDHVEAEARSALLADLAKRFVKAGVIDMSDARKLLDMAAGARADLLPGVLQVAGELVGGELIETQPGERVTFEQVAREWISGDLSRRFPDHVGDVTEGFRSTVEKRLEKAVFPIIGPKAVRGITRADCEDVMRQLPAPKGASKKGQLSRETRRQYAGLVNRVLNLAELAGYIDRNPLPRGWLPKPGARKRFPILYPAEDRSLLACTAVPLAWRLLWGFLHREGMRRGEAVALTWRDVDLEHGTVSLDENKTDHARFWKLGAGVAEALAEWKRMRGDVEADERVFTDEHGRPVTLDHTADVVRAHLEKAKLARPDLFSEGPNKGRFGTHCFRRSFVTRSLANDRSEDWVRARSGHKSTELLRYRQAAKVLGELALGELDALNLALPEFRPSGAVAHPRGAEVDSHPSEGSSRGNENPLIAPRTTREGGGTGRRTSLRC